MPKLKNITDVEFSFEGVVIPPGGISEEIEPDIHGRMLALYSNRTLINYDEEIENKKPIMETGGTSMVPPVVLEEGKALSDLLKVEEKPIPKFICTTCGKEVQSDRALKGHKVGAKHN